MTGEDHERRLSTVEANYTTLTYSMNEMKGYLGKLFEQQGEMKTSLALIAQNQVGMKEYQTKCDSERKDHDTRIGNCESFQKRLAAYAAVITTIGSLASPQLAKLWTRIFS